MRLTKGTNDRMRQKNKRIMALFILSMLTYNVKEFVRIHR